MPNDTASPRHKPDCEHITSGWKLNCTCGADKPTPPAPTDAVCCDPSAPVVTCVNCGKPVYTCEAQDASEEDNHTCPVHPGGAERSDGVWVCSDECDDAMNRPAPTADEVREAITYFKTRHMGGGIAEDTRVRTLLAALDRGQLKEAAYDSLYRAFELAAQEGSKAESTLRADNARLVEEVLTDRGQACDFSHEIDRLDAENATQAEQIKRLTEVLTLCHKVHSEDKNTDLLECIEAAIKEASK